MNYPAQPGSPEWTTAIAEQLHADRRFASALATWDGGFALRSDDGSSAAFRVYQGTVIDSGRRIGGDTAFTLTVPQGSWARMIAAERNTFMDEAMVGAFRVDGSGYDYLRLTKALSYVVDAARAVAGTAPAAPPAPSTSVPAPAARWSAQAHYLFIDGSLSYVEVSEPADPPLGTVVLLHTAGQSGVQYRRALPRLNELGYRAIVPDYPGHGRSEPASAGPVTDLGVYADWVEQVIAQLVADDERLVVAGCSIGGKITIDLATRLGARLDGAIAMAASADAGRGKRAALIRELEDIAAPSRTDRTQLGTRAVVGKAVEPELRELIATMHRREDPVISNSDLLGWTSHDLTERLGSIECPLLLVGGRDDLWLDIEAMKRTAARVTGARTVVLDGIGHYPPQEMADFADVLHSWIGELAGDCQVVPS